MKIWDKLLEVGIDNKERYEKIFSETIEKIRNNDFPIKIGELEREDYYIVTEESRMDSLFIHIVPKQVYNLFKEMQKLAPNEFLGFSILIGKYGEKDIRVSCFGVECSVLGKGLFNKKTS